MTIEVFYNYVKRKNSTKQASDGTQVECRLKENCSVTEPVLEIAGNNSITSITEFYMENRYYFVTDIVYISNDIYLIKGRIDVLATYRDSLLNSSAFVERCQLNYSDRIIDTMLPGLVNKIWNMTTTNVGSDGNFVIGVVSPGNSSNMGAVSYYIISSNNFNSLLVKMFTPSFYNFLTMEGNEAVQALFNPFQYVVSCKWIWGVETGSPQNITFGWWDAGVSGLLIQNRIVSKEYICSVEWPLENKEDWRNSPNFVDFFITIPYCGRYPISAEHMRGVTQIYVKMLIDISTAAVSFVAVAGTDSTGQILAVGNGNCGVDIPLSNASNSGNFLTSIASAAGSALEGNVLGIGAGAVSSVMSTVPKLSLNGGIGNGTGGAVVNHRITVESYGKKLSEDEPGNIQDVIGCPAYKKMTISNCGSYVKTYKYSCNINSTETVKNEINALMDGGVFIE